LSALVPLYLVEDNDETIAWTIDPVVVGDDLTAVAEVQLILKDDDCATDTDGLVLSSTDAAQLVILTHTATELSGEAYIPASSLQGAYTRFYHIDALDGGGHRRTAITGPVYVTKT
jgi:hypothetical protein